MIVELYVELSEYQTKEDLFRTLNDYEFAYYENSNWIEEKGFNTLDEIECELEGK